MQALFHNVDFLASLCGLAAFVVVILIWTAFLDKDPLTDRLRAVALRRGEFETERRKKNASRASLQGRSFVKEIVSRFKLSQGKSMADLRLTLRRAGYQARDAMFVFLFSKLALMAGLVAVCLFVFFFVPGIKIQPKLEPLLLVFSAIVGWMLPDIYIKNRSQNRGKTLAKFMPDALDLMVICAEAGLGLDASFDRVGREIAPSCAELAEEIGLTSIELNFLPDRHAALRGLAERVPLPNVQALVNTLIQTEKYGTPLAQSLRILSTEMRDDRMMQAEEKAARLPAILTVPMILFILPPLFIVLIGPAAIKVMDAVGKN